MSDIVPKINSCQILFYANVVFWLCSKIMFLHFRHWQGLIFLRKMTIAKAKMKVSVVLKNYFFIKHNFTTQPNYVTT